MSKKKTTTNENKLIETKNRSNRLTDEQKKSLQHDIIDLKVRDTKVLAEKYDITERMAQIYLKKSKPVKEIEILEPEKIEESEELHLSQIDATATTKSTEPAEKPTEKEYNCAHCFRDLGKITVIKKQTLHAHTVTGC